MVCATWRNSFAAFLRDVGFHPGARYSLDRIDNSGHYEPGNVRWATPYEQARNKRTVKKITINGVTQTLPEWSEVSRVPRKTIWRRLYDGWQPERAVFTPTTPLDGAC